MISNRQHTTLYDFFNQLDHCTSDQTCMQIFENNQWIRTSYRQLKQAITVTDICLKEIGLKPGDRVIFLADNRPETMIAFFSVLAAKGTVVFLDPTLPHNELQNLINQIDAGVLLASPKYLPLLTELSLSHLAVRNIESPSSTFEGLNSQIPPSLPPSQDNDTDVAVILFTSGTTGTAQGVMLTHNNFIAEIKGLHTVFSCQPGDNALTFLPIHHISPIVYNLAHLCAGATLTFISKIDGPTLLQAMQAVRPVTIGVVPLVLDLFCKNIQTEINKQSSAKKKIIKWLALSTQKTREFSSVNMGPVLFKKIHQAFGGKLKTIICGGAKANPESIAQLFSYGFNIYEAYGLSETTGIICANHAGQVTIGSVGTPFPNMEFKIHEQDANGCGEILTKGPMVMKGYFRNPEATRLTIQNGWLHTGDIGTINQHGVLSITGRIRETIVLATGKKVSPLTVESQYGEIEGIAEIAVFGMKSGNQTSETIHAAIVLTPELQQAIKNDSHHFAAIKNRIETLVHERAVTLPPNLQIQRVHIVDTIPKTAMLKVKRVLLSNTFNHISHAPEQPAIDTKDHHSSIETWISNWLIEKIRLAPNDIDFKKSFIYFGLDSLSATELCHDLQSWLKIEVNPTLIWEYSTIEKLASYLTQQLHPGTNTSTLPTKQDSHQPNDDPIVIVSIACRFPGNINSPQDFWHLLTHGQHGITEIPPERWNHAQFYDPNIESVGKMNSRWGGFINVS